MKLRRIDIQGFKSFRFKTGIEIGEGVTAVVGPNGCGKSNVVDAMRWAMGSQSPKDLRGRAMEDVIFAGSEQYPPHGFAEVSLTFENDRGDVPSEWREAPEIKVTRRLFRTGDSEYQMNGGRCRLRDIQNLFLGTGVGSREAYSIIEQGRIGFIVSARPEERRSIIEEAAGITRYKFQRKSAERRLEKSRENLRRIGDVLDEVQRQLGSLERQAKKAARWRVMSERRRILDIAAALARRDHAEAALKNANNELAQLQAEDRQRGIALQKAETELESAKVELAVRERQLSEATEEHFRTRARVDLLRNNVSHQEREHATLEQRRQVIATERSQQLELFEKSTERLDSIRGSRDTLATELETVMAELASAEEGAKGARERRAAVETDDRSTRESLTRLLGEAARVRAQLESAQTEETSIRSRREAAVASLETARSSHAAATEARDRAAVAVATSREKLEQAAAQADEARAREGRALENRTGAQEEHRSTTERLKATVARTQTLEALLRSGEGYGAGVRRALDAVANGRLAGIGRPVVERMRSDEERTTALIATLGPFAEALVAESTEAAESLVRWARERDLRLSVVTLEEPHQGPINGWGEAREPIPGWIAHVLQETHQASDLFSEGAVPRVATDGVLCPRSGVYVLGSGAEAVESVVQHTRELDEARAAKTRAEDAVVQKRRLLRAAEDELEGALQSRTNAESKAEEARLAHRQAGDALAEVERDFARAADQLRRYEQEEQELEGRAQAVTGRLGGLRERLEQLDAQVAEAQDKAAGLSADRAEAEDAERAASDRVGSIRITVAEKRERLRGVESELERLSESAAGAQRRRQALEHESQQVAKRLDELSSELQNDRGQLGEAIEKSQALEVTRQTAQEAHTKASGLVRDREVARMEVRQAREAVLQKVQRAQLQTERARSELEHAEESIAERFHLSVAVARRQTEGVEFDDEAKEELATLVSRIERLGPVNPAAEEEYAEALERHDYLKEQRDDLLAAIADLETAIRKMDATSKQLFSETYDAVNERFQELFPRLFRGGKGRLELTDPENMLETGVEIVVQPPGKRLQSMNLMSGGEKALTAVALVFAIFQLKPTPFCLLDEVDAPLDDANVGRFTDMVKEMSDTSQFVIITHNKTTMEAASTLYGVTMEEPGVSKVVGVRLQGEMLDVAS